MTGDDDEVEAEDRPIGDFGAGVGDVRELSLRRTDSTTLKKAALRAGMRTLRTDGAGKVMWGITSVEEVMLVTAEDKE